MQIAVFKLGGEEYAVETSKITGINKMTDITKVPCADKAIEGLINLRGNILSIINPYILLGISEEERNAENIMIIETDGETLGIMVDKVTEVVDIEEEMVKDISLSGESKRDYIRGTLNLHNNVVTLIDIDRFLDLAVYRQ